MPFATAGSNIPARLVFNSGTLDFGSQRVVEVVDLGVKSEAQIVPLFVLGSILAQDFGRHSLKFTLTGKAKSFPQELYQMFYGASVPGTPNEIDVLDGQATLLNPVLTVFDKNNKEIQFQFSGALFSKIDAALKMDDFAEFDFELSARNIVILNTV